MKDKSKKTIMIILIILTALSNLYYLINVVSGKIDVSQMMGDGLFVSKIQIIVHGICIIINAILAILVLKDIKKCKTTIITLNVIQLLLGNSFNVISAIISIILVSSMTKDENEEKKKENKNLPELEEVPQHKWYVYLGIFIFLFIICYTPALKIIPIKTKVQAIILTAMLYVIQITLLIIPMFKELKRDFKAFKSNFKLYIKNMLPRFGIILIIYIISSLAVTRFVSAIPTNQELISQMPIYVSAFLAIIIAPLTEELMFRGFMKKFIKNDIAFIIISSIVFGGLHVINATEINQYLYIIPYSILGLAFSLNYVKTKNIASNMMLHATWNSLAILALIVTKLIQI